MKVHLSNACQIKLVIILLLFLEAILQPMLKRCMELAIIEQCNRDFLKNNKK